MEQLSMETKKHQYDLSLPYSIHSYINSLLQHVNNPALTDNVFTTSQNYLVVISEKGYFNKVSASLIELLGYSEVELLSISVNKIVVDGKFVLEDTARNYYFENTICSKSNIAKKFKWRLIPYITEGAYAFVGWEIKP